MGLMGCSGHRCKPRAKPASVSATGADACLPRLHGSCSILWPHPNSKKNMKLRLQIPIHPLTSPITPSSAPARPCNLLHGLGLLAALQVLVDVDGQNSDSDCVDVSMSRHEQTRDNLARCQRQGSYVPTKTMQKTTMTPALWAGQLSARLTISCMIAPFSIATILNM